MMRNGFITSRIQRFSVNFNRIAAKNYRAYIVFMIMLASIGYAFVLLFPALMIISGQGIIRSLLVDVIDWEAVSIMTLVMLVSLAVTVRIIRTRPKLPVGLALQQGKTQQVHALVEQIQAQYKSPRIHHIILTDQYELDIIKTSRWMLPVWSSNTLIIGLPLLAAVSPAHLKMMVVRRMGQFSGKHNLLNSLLYQLAPVWEEYAAAYGRHKTLESKLLMLFYRLYAAVYRGASIEVARRGELYADRSLQDHYNHQDVCEMITMDFVARYFLDNHYWQAFNKFVGVKNLASIKPYSSLPAVIQTNLVAAKSEKLIQKVIESDYSSRLRLPMISARLENIGHDSPMVIASSKHSAAEHLLGKSLPSALSLMDKLWQKGKKEQLAKQRARDKSIFRFLRPALKEA